MKKLFQRITLRDALYSIFFLCFLLVVIAFLIFIGLLFLETTKEGGLPKILEKMACWFDPVYIQYNLLLISVAVLIAPFMTVFYIYSMKSEKLRRLHKELPKGIWEDNKKEIEERVASIFRIRNYIGSLSALTIVIMLGCGIIMLLKPLPLSKEGCGVDYSLGANFLIFGPFMENFIQGKPFIHEIIFSLTGFQFGFLGAYVYFIGYFVRSYFILDLTPNTFVICTVRIVTGSILALILSFFLQDLLKEQAGLLPIVAFFIGFFPSRGLLLIEKICMSVLKSKNVEYAATPLSQLPGMSYAHEVRFNREGFDNIENLTVADPLELSLRTGFSYGQLKAWISQSRLAAQLGPDYRDFFKATGIDSLHSLKEFFRKWDRTEDPCSVLDEATGSKMKGKILALSTLIGPEGGKKAEGTP